MEKQALETELRLRGLTDLAPLINAYASAVAKQGFLQALEKDNRSKLEFAICKMKELQSRGTHAQELICELETELAISSPLRGLPSRITDFKRINKY